MNNLYWTFQLSPIDKNEKDLLLSFVDVFEDKNIGEDFKASINILYSFDSELIKEDRIDYIVKVRSP